MNGFNARSASFFAPLIVAAAALVCSGPMFANAQSWSSQTHTTHQTQIRDVKNNASPGNFHLFLTPFVFYVGRSTSFGGGGSFDWELTTNFAVRAGGYYGYYNFDRDERREGWWRAESGIRIHGSDDRMYNDEIDVHSSSSSSSDGYYVYTSSQRLWVDRPSWHRITHGGSAGVILQRSPTDFELPSGPERFPMSTELVAYVGYAHTDSMERGVNVQGYGYRSKAQWQMLYADLLVSIAHLGGPDDVETPGRFGFRAGAEGAYGEDLGYGGGMEIGLNPGRAQGWYFMLKVSASLNLWL